MDSRLFGRWLPVLLVMSLAGSAFAEIRGATSLEWVTCSAEVIVLGKVSSVAPVPGPGDVIYEDGVFEVEEVIKGDAKDKRMEFTWRAYRGGQTIQPLQKDKQSVLLFLSKSKDNGPEHRMDGRWVPLAEQGRPWMIDLSVPLKEIYSKEMTVVEDPKAMLAIVREWAKSPLNKSLRREVPFDSPVFKQLYSGSSCYLVVPAEEKYRAEFMKKSASPQAYERAAAALELASYPGKETEAVLRGLLKDDAERVGYYANDEIYTVRYHVRAAAYQSLQTLGLAVPEMKLERQPTAEEQRALREKSWKASFAAVLKEGWTITVTDGPSRMVAGRERIIVKIDCGRDKERATFTLVPKEWRPQDADVAGKVYLGINGPQSQGGRGFYVEGTLSQETSKAIVAYFGLQK